MRQTRSEDQRMKLEIINKTKFKWYINHLKLKLMSETPKADPKAPTVAADKPLEQSIPKPPPFPVDSKGIKKADQPKTEAANNAVQTITQTTPEDPDKYKFTFKKTIGTAVFIGFVVGLIYFMQTLQMIQWWIMDDTGFQVVMWIFFWTIVIVLGFEKGSLKEFMFNVIKVIYSPAMDSDSKLMFIKNMMEKLAGLAILLNEECEKKKTKLTIFGKDKE